MMNSPPHSTVTNTPRTLPACFFSGTSKRMKTESISSGTTENVLKNENRSETLPDYLSSDLLEAVKTDGVPSANSNDATISSNVVQLENESKVEEIPIEECETDINSPFKSEPSESIPADNVKVSSTETLLPDVTSSNIVDDSLPSVSSSDNVSAVNSSSSKRFSCRYGTSCYRQNPQHKSEFSHPGDDDYVDEEPCTSSTDVNTTSNKPPCWYGPRCYRKNKEHLEQFSHSFSSSGRPKRSTKVRVEIDVHCDSDDSEELEDFHTDSDEFEASFIDDHESSDDNIDSAEDVSEISDGSVTSEDEDEDKKRKKKASKKTKKKKI